MRTRVGLVIVVLLALVCMGCAQKFTRANYELVSVGMADKAEVKGLLGDPRVPGDDMWLYVNSKELVQAKIFFDESDTVMEKKWEDMTDLDSFTLSDEP